MSGFYGPIEQTIVCTPGKKYHKTHSRETTHLKLFSNILPYFTHKLTKLARRPYDLSQKIIFQVKNEFYSSPIFLCSDVKYFYQGFQLRMSCFNSKKLLKNVSLRFYFCMQISRAIIAITIIIVQLLI